MLSRFARGSLLIFAGLFAGKVLAMLTNVVMARRLDAHLFGVYLLGLSILQVAATACNLGIPGVLPRFLARCDAGREPGEAAGQLATANGLCLVAACTASALLYAFSGKLAAGVFKIAELDGMLRLISPVIPIAVVTSVFLAAYRGFQKTAPKVVFQDLLPCVLTLVLFIAFSYSGYGLSAAYLAFALSSALILGGMLLSADRLLQIAIRPPWIDLKTARAMIGLAWPLGVESAVWITYGQIDKLLIGFFLPPSEVGIYAAAASVTVILTIIPQAFSYLSLPVFSTLARSQATNNLVRTYKKTAKAVFLISFPLFLCVALLPKEILAVLYGARYTEGAEVLRVLAVGSFVSCLLGPAPDLLVGAGKTKVPLLASTAGCAGTVSLNYLLIPVYGVRGAAVATCVGSLLSFLVTGFFVQRHLGVLPWDRDYVLWPAICLALTPMIPFGTSLPSFGSHPVNAAITGLAYCITSYGILYVISSRNVCK